MPRAVSNRRHQRRRKILKQAKGYWGRRSKLFRPAKDAVAKALTYAYRDRRQRRRDMRRLWISRISAACREHGTRYSVFMHGLSEAEVVINRKALSNMAIEDPKAFAELVAVASGDAKPAASKAKPGAQAPSAKATTKVATAGASPKKTSAVSETKKAATDAKDDES